jgi:hypothetical protein
MLEAAERAIPAMLAAGQSHEAVQATRQLAEAEPDEIGVSVLLFDALVAAGFIAEARERLEVGWLAAMREGEPLPDGVAERLARSKRIVLPQPTPAAGTLAVLGQRLVGRDATLDALLREAERAREGRPRRVVLAGPAGIGKSRVLDELEARMRLRGARVVRVRLHPGMRDVPYSAFADTVRALSHLPSALGVSEQSARVLVGLLPELASRYPGAPGAKLPRENLDVALRDAAADLFASVAEQRLVVHMVDDLHYADDASRAVFTAVRLETERRTDETLRLLSVRCLRWISAHDLYPTDAVLEVAPLTREDVRAMLADVAMLPDASWGEALVDRLWMNSNGKPQLVLQAVRASAATGLLSVSSGAWTAHDPEALLRTVSELAGPGPLLATLNPTAERVLTLLAAWGRPMDERDVAGLCAADVPSISADQLRGALATLDELGLVQSRESNWAVAHDTVFEAVLRNSARTSPTDPFDALLVYWGDPRRVTMGVMEHLSLLAGQGDEPSRAIRLARRVLRAPALDHAGISARALASRVAKGAGHPEWETPIRGQLGFISRQSDRTRTLLLGGAPLLVVFVVWLVAMLQPRLVVQAEPMVESRRGRCEFVVQPRVALVNGFGQTLAREAQVRVRTTRGALTGDTLVSAAGGRVQFRRLVLQTDSSASAVGPIELQFVGPWYVRDARALVRGAEPGIAGDAFRVAELTLNGQPVVGAAVRAPVGDSLVFDMTIEYTTTRPTTRYVLGLSATWAAGDSVATRVIMLARPVEGAWRTLRVVVPGAQRPGGGHLVALLGEESAVLQAQRSGVAGGHWEELRSTGRLSLDGAGNASVLGTAVRVEFVEGR